MSQMRSKLEGYSPYQLSNYKSPLSLASGDSLSSKKNKKPDRFIPNRICQNLYNLFKEQKVNEVEKQTKAEINQKKYCDLLTMKLFQQEESHQHQLKKNKILRFNQRDQKQNQMYYNNIKLHQNHTGVIKKKRNIQKKPYKILEAPGLRDDFYLNLIDWSQTNNIAVGLQSSVYVWSGCSSKVQKIYQAQDYADYICSVAFCKNNPYIAFGNTQGEVKMYDILKQKEYSRFQNVHSGRIGSIGCTNNLVSTGGRDGTITIQDFRTNTQIISYQAHQQQICGLKFSPDSQMIASGGNDNKLSLFSLKTMNKMATFSEHKAAVKALSFDANSPILASGGGTADRHIRLFSTHTLTQTFHIDTGSQICNLMFSPISNELVTTHGYSLNQINLWRVDNQKSIEKVQTLTGHNCRVLYLAGQHNGGKIVTGAGDQSLRFWNIFEQKKWMDRFDLR